MTSVAVVAAPGAPAGWPELPYRSSKMKKRLTADRGIRFIRNLSRIPVPSNPNPFSTYARNGVSVVAPVLSDGSLTYTPGISSRDGSNSTWSHADIKNSLRQTGANETTSATKHYDAFGNQTSSAGTWHGPFQYGGNFGYQTDPDSNLELLGHRYYVSSTGRFLTRDPIKDGRNWYGYCANNPINSYDATGLWKAIIIIGDHEWWEALTVGIALAKFKRWVRQQGATEVVVIRQPTDSQAEKAISDPSVQGVVVIGHGPPHDVPGGWVRLRDHKGRQYLLDLRLIQRIANGRHTKLKLILVFACHSDRLSDALGTIAADVYTYSGYVGYFDTWYIPRPKHQPTKIGGGGLKR